LSSVIPRPFINRLNKIIIIEKRVIFINKKVNMKKFTEELLKGKKFGMLTCIRFSHKNNKWIPYFYWRCDCGKEILNSAPSIVYGTKYSCGCTRRKYIYRNAHSQWEGYEEISKTYWSSIQYSAKKRHLPINVSMKDAWDKFIQQDRKCALTGIPIHFPTGRYIPDGTASLDRIDSTKGYTIDNIQWLHRIVNYMKQKTSQTEFIEWCRKVANYSDNLKRQQNGRPEYNHWAPLTE
jgi:hypothetical protein